ncbi:hypothetical protein CONCODRAFT_28935, partial [Conidiobolus coronatus NRRL 28638]
KRRQRPTLHQLETLEQEFQHNFYPSAEARRRMAEQLRMTPRAIQIWFMNRR